MATDIVLDGLLKRLCLIPLALAGLPAAAAPAPGPTASRVVACVRNPAVPRLALPAELLRLQTACGGVLGCGGRDGAFRDWQTIGTGPLWTGQINHAFNQIEQDTIIAAARAKAASQQPPGLGLVYITYMTSLNSATTAYVGGTIHYARCGSNVSAE